MYFPAVVTAPVLLKIVSLGDQLLLNWVHLRSAQQKPQQLELSVDTYTTSNSGIICNTFATAHSIHEDIRATNSVCVQGYLLATKTWMNLSASYAARLVVRPNTQFCRQLSLTKLKVLLQLAVAKRPCLTMVLLMMNSLKVPTCLSSVARRLFVYIPPAIIMSSCPSLLQTGAAVFVHCACQT